MLVLEGTWKIGERRAGGCEWFLLKWKGGAGLHRESSTRERQAGGCAIVPTKGREELCGGSVTGETLGRQEAIVEILPGGGGLIPGHMMFHLAVFATA